MEIETSAAPARVEIETSAGPARVEIERPSAASRLLLVLTHGAGGGVDSADLLAVRQAGLDLGAVVARVLQPYRARGARAPGASARQDAAWLDIVSALREVAPGVPLVQGGRSNGARVVCRTARAAGAAAVVALAFPLHPPGRPERSRADELRDAGTPVLAVSGERDPFGAPDAGLAARVVVMPGETHALSRHPEAVGAAVRDWLRELPELLGGGNRLL